MNKKILIVDDEQSVCVFLSLALKAEYQVSAVYSAKECAKIMGKQDFDLVLLDMVIGRDDGIEVLKMIKAENPRMPVIMMTAFGSIKTSVDAMKNGAFMYLTKPLDVDELRVHIKQALEMNSLSEEVDFLSDELKKHQRYTEIIGNTPPMQQVYDLIDRLKDVDASVIITGESGTGKELAARALHFSGKRKNQRFVAINCAAIPENLLEAELFGHKRGTFTGAVQDKKGKFEVADGGTIFFDEIGELPLGLQSKLLRAIQEKEITPLGGTEPRKVNVRVLAATNVDLAQKVEEGAFRQDLYYRLNVMNLVMPPLRERREDIPTLCRYFMDKYNSEQNKHVQHISEDVVRRLMEYDYPGNVRQLANIIEHAMILTQGAEIQMDSLPVELRSEKRTIQDAQPISLAGMTIKEIEKLAIRQALERNGGRRDLSARELEISVRTLQNKIHEYEL